jgi:hypothetical protein
MAAIGRLEFHQRHGWVAVVLIPRSGVLEAVMAAGAELARAAGVDRARVVATPPGEATYVAQVWDLNSGWTAR